MKKQVVLTRKELNEYVDKQANIIIGNMLKNKNKISENRDKVKATKRLTNIISESIMQKIGLKKSVKLNESMGNGLFVEVRFVQSGDDDYNEIDRMFCGEQEGYCEANSQPVIDYLKQWDDGEHEPTPNQPRIARGDTQYADENGDYTLLYNSSVGGCFLLYRPATEQEIAWYNDNGPGSMGESKRRNTSKYVNETIEYDDYGSISDALAQCGWAYSNAYDVHNKKTGQTGVRYIIEPYPNNLKGIEPMDVEEMKEKMVALLGQGNVIFSEGQHRLAPEIKNLSMVVLNGEMTESIYKKKVLKESIYNRQWEGEIQLFFRGLNNGQAIVDDDCVAVEWGHDETDPRFIVYEYGEMRLRDDHFSKQYSRSLTDKEIGDIYWALKHIYNVNKDDTKPIAYTDDLDNDYE